MYILQWIYFKSLEAVHGLPHRALVHRAIHWVIAGEAVIKVNWIS